mgnify:CR=1 FL=1
MRLIIIILSLSIFACKNDKSVEKIQEIRTQPGGNAELIKNPVSMEGIDSVNVAKIKFEEMIFDFGSVKEGAKVIHRFRFKNIGKVPLIIKDARSTCGCTASEYPNHPISPGDTSSLNVIFNTQNKENFQVKHVTVLANTYPSETSVSLQGQVITKNGKPKTTENH